MALISCPECESRVSSRAPACPHCGFPIAAERASLNHNPTPPQPAVYALPSGPHGTEPAQPVFAPSPVAPPEAAQALVPIAHAAARHAPPPHYAPASPPANHGPPPHHALPAHAPPPAVAPQQHRAPAPAGPQPRTNREETVYADEGVRITTARAVFGATTYALANITTVSSHTVPADRDGPNWFNGIGVLLSILAVVGGGGCGVLFSSVSGGVGSFLAFGLFAAMAFLVAWVWNAGLHDMHSVRISTSAGEQNVLQSQDARRVKGIVHALNEAIARRG